MMMTHNNCWQRASEEKKSSVFICCHFTTRTYITRWCEFMWWITNQILNAGVKKITEMGANEKKIFGHKMGKNWWGVEFIKFALEIIFFIIAFSIILFTPFVCWYFHYLLFFAECVLERFTEKKSHFYLKWLLATLSRV